MKQPTILVTGANGQLGMELRVLAAGYPQYEFVFASRDDLPIHNFELARNFFTTYQPQYCINCAAYTAVDKAESEKDLAYLINGEAVGVLAAITKEHDCRFIHISTDYVFDGIAKTPYKEDATVNPQSVYGASKLEGEVQALRFNPGSIIIRTSWVYSSFGKNFVKTMMRLMNEKPEINVVNDQVGSPTYAADLAETIMNVIGKTASSDVEFRNSNFELSRGGIYHFSNTGIISWYDFAVAIKEIIGSNCIVNPITTSQYPTPATRPAWSVLDKTKIQRTFGIQLKDWKESLAICIRKINESK